MSRLGGTLAMLAAVVVAAIVGAVTVTAFAGRGRPASTAPADATAAPVASGDALTDAIARNQAMLRGEPRNWLAWSDLGSAYVQQGRVTADPAYYPKAQQALDRSLALNSVDNFQAMTGMAALTAARHGFAESLGWSRRAAKINPASSLTLAVMSDALNELGRYDEAQRALQRAVDLKPGISTFTRVSYVRELRGDVPGALAAMRRARDDAFSPPDAAFCDYYLGSLSFNAGQLAAAQRYVEHGLRLDPSYSQLYQARARVLAAQGHVAAAVSAYLTAVDRYPAPEFLAEFGDYLTALGRRADAKQQYDLVAIEDRLFRANGVNQDLEIAAFEAEHGQAAAAVRAGRAEWGRRHSIVVADALGWALHMVGDDRAALGYAQFATLLGYRNALYYFHLGIIEKSLRESVAARRHLTFALRINPFFSPLRATVARRALASLGAKR